MKKTLLSVIPVLAFAMVTAQAAAPALSYEISGNELIINYTGTLLQSADAVTWTEVASASSPYQVALSDKKLFFCAKGTESNDITIPLSDKVNLNLIWINPGTFTMGSPSDELGRWDDEVQHQVTLTQNYWLSDCEVTQGLYEAVMGTNPSAYEFYRCPVESVSWSDALEFCAKVTEIERRA
ncbi:MAG: SUMF1/EgtB/PvdO family nonheme iron enzyme, partial [Verrucomicrobia bacterium]|nr:SUMF1/EgtB/PvdO family nonheme iron enzyme [Verrucomicrobiota bacterium]